MEIPQHFRWTFTDLSEWTGEGTGALVQKIIFGILKQDAEVIEKILRDGGATVLEGTKESVYGE